MFGLPCYATHLVAMREGAIVAQGRPTESGAPVSGSVVLSGSCTYHQPIIPDDLLRQL